MNPFEGMATFAQVVEAGSFTRAGAELGVSKSSVSETIRRLEETLGVRLLDRTTRRVGPTEAVHAFYAHCRRALAEARAGRVAAQAAHTEPVGRLRVAAPEAFARMALAPVLRALLEAYPQLQIELVEGVGAVDLVEAGIDLAIRVSAQPADALIVRRLGVSRVIIVAAPAYLDRRTPPAHPGELADHRTIGFPPPLLGARMAVRARRRRDRRARVAGAAQQWR
jgi:DNA-binding transcriptional LysR family regulator